MTTSELKALMEQQAADLATMESEIKNVERRQRAITNNFNKKYAAQLTFWDKLADKIASFAGSWRFIGIFFGIILVWTVSNVIGIFGIHFDPYPFILLNLILSCIAALQAPFILMSQNRISDRDRKRDDHDFQVNLQAEMEIKILHDKVDYHIAKQWQKLLEIQMQQMESLEKIEKKLLSAIQEEKSSKKEN